MNSNLAKKTSVSSSIDAFLNSINNLNTIYVAYSGGLDSSVLLHSIKHRISVLQLSIDVVALHVNHQLQECSSEWVSHCSRQALAMGVEFTELKVEIENTKRKGLEAIARQKRYQALANYVLVHDEKGVLVTGHHQRDQAETVLLNLFRGAGVAGLAAMPVCKLINQKVKHCRPLLQVPYDDLVGYAESNDIAFIEDPSNQSTEFRRNFVRHKVLPEIEQAWSNAQQQISCAAQHMQEANALLESYADKDLQTIEHASLYICLQDVDKIPWMQQKNTIRYWLKRFHPTTILTAEHFRWIFDALQSYEKSQNQAYQYQLSKGSLRLYKNRLYMLQKMPCSYEYSFSQLSGFIKVCEFESKEFYPFFYNDLQGKDKVILRFLSESDQVNKKALKTYFQQNSIPSWERAFWPVLADENNQVFSILGCSGCLPNQVDQKRNELQISRDLVWKMMGLI